MTKRVQKKTLQWIIVGLLGAVTIALIIVVLILLNKPSNTNENDPQNSSTTHSTEKELSNTSEQDDWIYFKVGETIPFATQEMKVNSVKLVDFIKATSAYSSPMSAGDGAKFLVINMTVKNTTNQTFSYMAFGLVNQKGSQYQEYNAIGEIDNYMTARDLSPNIPETGNVVYRVSDDSTSFELFGQNSSTGKTNSVKLNP